MSAMCYGRRARQKAELMAQIKFDRQDTVQELELPNSDMDVEARRSGTRLCHCFAVRLSASAQLM